MNDKSWLTCFALLMIIGYTWAQQTSSLETLQAEVARLRQRVAELEGLKDQLTKLEGQLQELQKGQKASDLVTRRFDPLTLHGYIQMRYESDTAQPEDVTDLSRGRSRDNNGHGFQQPCSPANGTGVSLTLGRKGDSLGLHLACSVVLASVRPRIA